MATAGGISSSQVLEITKCSICQESLNIPKVLPCIHTFCLHCLEKYGKGKKSGDKVSCPLCRRDFKLELGFKELPNNYFILQLLQFNQQSTSELITGQLVACDLCCELNEKKPATVYCVECVQNLCQPCGTRHGKQRVSKGHNIVRLEDKPSVDELIRLAPSYCEKHPSKEIEFYCYDCKMIVCVVCYVDHKVCLHKCSDVRESAAKFCGQRKRDIEMMEPYISMRLDEVNQIERDKKDLQDKTNATRKDIDMKYDQLKLLLDSHKRQLKSQVDSFQTEILKKLETRKEEVEKQLTILESFKTYCEQMAMKGTPTDISRYSTDLHVRAEELVKTQNELLSCTPPSPMVIKFAPSCATICNNVVGQLAFEDAVPVLTTEESVACKPVKNMSLKSGSFLDQASVVHIIPGHRGGVWGVDVLGSNVFVARNAERYVEVYDSNNFSLAPRQLRIRDSKLHSPRLGACSHLNCLYVSTSGDKESVIYRVRISDSYSTNWTLKGEIKSLSVTHKYKHNVLVILRDSKKWFRMQEYSTSGKLIREIALDRKIQWPSHCIELSDGNFVVSHGGEFSKQHRICILNDSGKILKAYGGSPGAGFGQLDCPYHLSVDRYDHVFVADYCNNRVQLLSPTLTLLGNIGHKPAWPVLVRFDEINHRLYIGVMGGRVLVIECTNHANDRGAN